MSSPMKRFFSVFVFSVFLFSSLVFVPAYASSSAPDLNYYFSPGPSGTGFQLAPYPASYIPSGYRPSSLIGISYGPNVVPSGLAYHTPYNRTSFTSARAANLQSILLYQNINNGVLGSTLTQWDSYASSSTSVTCNPRFIYQYYPGQYAQSTGYSSTFYARIHIDENPHTTSDFVRVVLPSMWLVSFWRTHYYTGSYWTTTEKDISYIGTVTLVANGSEVYTQSITSSFSLDLTVPAPNNAPVDILLSFNFPTSFSFTPITTSSCAVTAYSKLKTSSSKTLGSYLNDSSLPDDFSSAYFGAIRYASGSSVSPSDPTLQPQIDDLRSELESLGQDVDELKQMVSLLEEEQKKTSEAVQEATEAIKDQTEENKKGFASIVDAITNLPQTIFDGIVHLFVPTEEDMQEVVDAYKVMFNDKLGFVAQAGTLIGELFDNILDFMNTISDDTSYTFHFPGIHVNLPEGVFEIVPEQDVSLNNDYFLAVRPWLGTITIIICIFAILNTGTRLLEAIFITRTGSYFWNSGGSDAADMAGAGDYMRDNDADPWL